MKFTLALGSCLLALLPVLHGVTDAADSIPEFVLPEPPGPYAVRHSAFELVDTSRLDPFNATHFRRLMVTRFDPAEKVECRNLCHVHYMSPKFARLEDELLVPRGWVPGVLEAARLQSCCNGDGGNVEAIAAEMHRTYDNTKFPLLIYSPGGNTSRLQQSALVQAVASRGYTILSVDHPYEVDLVEFPDGTVVPGGRVNFDELNERIRSGSPSRAPRRHLWPLLRRRSSRADDGHGSSRRGGMNLDGMQFGRVVQDGFGSSTVPQAFVLLGAVGHNSSDTGPYDPSWGQFWGKMHTPPHDGVWTREVSLAPAVHNSFTDYSLLVDTAGVRYRLSDHAKERMAGPLEGKRTMEILAAYVGDFYGFVLKGADEGLYKGPSGKFPEVSFLPYQ
ncbi:hypothetical protein AJ79_00088 [Helicocarpus griseus UAMH5409]|uniref:1-alkyl-2-acetylglycerophosphocholine esterase n=1 Tax=Helicocarpus griseus UAMH5409 TaxID=1447875 RepID=A0A2B7Y4J6_9EURO|nr:hypothetical protein AJ79_00088 [Helicocarpus griseus UAMH5409]